MSPSLEPVQDFRNTASKTLALLDTELRKSEGVFMSTEKGCIESKLREITSPEKGNTKFLLRMIRKFLSDCLARKVWEEAAVTRRGEGHPNMERRLNVAEELRSTLQDLHRAVNINPDDLLQQERGALSLVIQDLQKRIRVTLQTIDIDPGSPTEENLSPFDESDADDSSLPHHKTNADGEDELEIIEEETETERKRPAAREKKRKDGYQNSSGASGRHRSARMR